MNEFLGFHSYILVRYILDKDFHFPAQPYCEDREEQAHRFYLHLHYLVIKQCLILLHWHCDVNTLL